MENADTLDFTVRFVREQNGDTVLLVIPGAGASEAQAYYLASAMDAVLDWDQLHTDLRALRVDSTQAHGSDSV